MTPRVWLVGADMGYGHLRAIHPLRNLSHNGVVVLGANDGTSGFEEQLWKRLLGVYSAFSRARGVPLIGKSLFGILDRFLRIPSRYPMRNLSESTFQVNMLESLIRKGLCSGLVEHLKRTPLPLVTSFYAMAIAADYAGHEHIYCIICDADLNRVWVAKDPWESRIVYFAPCGKAAQRLRAYGVPSERIYVTGYPLPEALLGDESLSTLKGDLGQRLRYLDPEGRFWRRNAAGVEHFLGSDACVFRNDRVLTLTYAVGGAGAQRDLGGTIMRSLRELLAGGQIRLNLVSGTNESVREYFEEVRSAIGDAARSVEIIHAPSVEGYFDRFNQILRTTDILWTKPSELCFYSALGIPILMSPPIGAQEYFNRRWLQEIRAGIKQEKPEYVVEWLFEFLRQGRLADAAWSGFLNARKLGTYKIREVLQHRASATEDSPLLR